MKISVNAPSYRRADDVKTLAYLPYCRIWVDEGEAEEYRRHYPDADIIACPSGVQGNLCRVRNYILDEEFKRGMDVVLIIDDDLSKVEQYFYDAKNNFGYNVRKVDADEFLVFVQKYSLMAMELGAKFWGVNCNHDRMAYRHCTPFSTVAYIGGPFQCFLKGNRCRYDERLPLKEDYDMTLQQLNKERVVLRVNSYHYCCKQSTNVGGCSSYRNREYEHEQLMTLQKKWGSGIVKVDDTNKGRSEKRKLADYNPIIHVPIGGV